MMYTYYRSIQAVASALEGNISSELWGSASSILNIISLSNTFVDPFGRQCFVVKSFPPIA